MVIMTTKLKTFEIVFNDPSKAFYCSGDKVAGNVVVEVCEVTRVSAVRVLGVGCAKVEYLKGKQRCREEVEYLRYEDTLHLDQQPRDADGSVTLRPGNRYQYMFGFELPQPGQLVSSHKSKFGCVRYYVRAVMERPTQNALQCEKHFEVEEPLDVNTADLLAPATASKQKKVTCMFIPDGHVSISAKIDRKGFCEGEEIRVDAQFENTCSRIVVPKAAIVSRQAYRAGGRTKLLRQKLTSVRGDHIISGMGDMWQGKSIRVPKLRPSLLGCDLISVDYALMIYIHIPGSEKLVVELPLVIGTIPFSGCSRTNSMSSTAGSSFSSFASSFPSSSFPSSSFASSPSWAGPPPRSAPPSYSDLRHARPADSPLAPLLDHYEDEEEEEEEDGIFMRFPPPPAYTEVDGELESRTRVLQVW